MKSRLEEDLRIGDLEGLIMDKFQVDSFQPKFCDEKDVAVVAFLVTQKESAAALCDYIARGPFNFLNVEASSSPDEGGSYVVLAELDRSQEMFDTIDQLLRYIDRQVHIRDWFFKPYSSDKHLPWNKDNFVKSVPQNPQEFQSGNNGDSKDRKSAADRVPQKTRATGTGAKAPEAAEDSINYSLLARIVEREISKSSRSYFVEFQKQFRKVSKDNRRILHHFKEIKTDHQQLVKQLDLHQRREKLALMREQQDVKRIQALEDRLTYLLVAGQEKREIAFNEARTPTISVEPAGASAVEIDGEEIVDPDVSNAEWEPGPRRVDTKDSFTDEAVVQEAEILPPETGPSTQPAGDSGSDPTAPSDPEAVAKAIAGAGEVADATAVADEPATPSDDSPVSALFRQAMQASEKKDYPKAIERFTRIIELSPDEPRAFYNLAILHFRLADYEKAEQFASAAIDLGADGARKILDKASAKKSGKSAKKAESQGQAGIDADADGRTGRTRRGDSRVPPAAEPFSGFEEQTVEIDGPHFSVAAAPDEEVIESADSDGDLPVAATEALEEIVPPSTESPGDSDVSVIDSVTPAAAKQTDETGAGVEPSAQLQPTAEQKSPADSPPTITEEPFDIEDLPTAALDDFIQNKADGSQPLVEESVVEELPADEKPTAKTSDQSPSAAASAAETEPPAAGMPVEELSTRAPEDEIDTAKVEKHPKAAQRTTDPQAAAARPEEDVPGREKPPAAADTDLFARGLAASKQKNYAQALQHFTKFVEQNPQQPRGFYNLAILHYRLKDFETARDMARRALDMGVGSAQKVYEKSQIRLAKERNTLLDSDETASTDTIFEELDTNAFETIDPSSLEEIAVTDAVVHPPSAAPAPEDIPTASEDADAAAPHGTDSEIAPAEPVADGPQPAEDQGAEAIPEFPVLTGEFAQEAGVTDVDKDTDADEEKPPEMEATPVAESRAVPESSPAAAKTGKPAPSRASTDETVVARASSESKPAAPKTGKKKPPAGQPETDPENASEDLFAKGMKAYAAKNFDQAIEIFNRFIALRPREPRGYYNLAIVHYRRKDYATAGINAEKAVKLGARAAKKILRKIKKKQQKTGGASPGAAVEGKKRQRKRPSSRKSTKAATVKPKGKPDPAQIPEAGRAGTAPISTPEPIESPATGGNIGDISDYDTDTFDIAEVLGHDPVVWDADDMEEEVDTSEVQSPLIGNETSDDVIVFESAAAGDPANLPISKPSGSVADATKGSAGGGPDKSSKANDGDGGEVPGSDVFSLGMAASEKKEYLKAIRYFKKFTELSPKDPRGYYNLAVVSYRLKSYETAREHAKRAFELGSKPAAKILKKLKSMRVAA